MHVASYLTKMQNSTYIFFLDYMHGIYSSELGEYYGVGAKCHTANSACTEGLTCKRCKLAVWRKAISAMKMRGNNFLGAGKKYPG